MSEQIITALILSAISTLALYFIRKEDIELIPITTLLFALLLWIIGSIIYFITNNEQVLSYTVTLMSVVVFWASVIIYMHTKEMCSA